MDNSLYYLIVFESQNHAYFLENKLIKTGYEVEYLQAPKNLTKSCNAALKVTKKSLEFIKKVTKSYNLRIYRIYKHYQSEDGKKIFRVVKI